MAGKTWEKVTGSRINNNKQYGSSISGSLRGNECVCVKCECAQACQCRRVWVESSKSA